MAVLLIALSILLVFETVFAGITALALPHDQTPPCRRRRGAGLVVGAVSSLLGVAGAN